MSGSLVRKLLIRLLAVTGIALVATGSLLVWQFEHSTAIIRDRGLGTTLEVIKDNLRLGAQGQPVETLPTDFKARFNEEFFFTVSDEAGRAFLSVPQGRDHAYHPFEPDSGNKPQYFEHNFLESGENYLGVTQRVTVGEREFWVQLVEEIPHWQGFLHFSLEIFLHGVGVVIVLHFLGTAVLAYLTLKTSFEPVARAARQVRNIVPGHSDIRIALANLPKEVVPLGEAINAALNRLDRALASQKRFTADAAHELLTPLAVIKAHVETIEDQEVAKSLSGDVDEMVEMVTQLLELSELESEAVTPNEVCDLRQIASDALSKLAPLAIRAGIEPEMTGAGEPVPVRGCQKSPATAVTNLIKNVIQHATGATRMEVSVQRDGCIVVMDDGPGVPAEMREQIFERFRRASGKSGGGKGLGLAIVSRSVEAHHGKVYVTEGPGGKGAAFVIDLPA